MEYALGSLTLPEGTRHELILSMLGGEQWGPLGVGVTVVYDSRLVIDGEVGAIAHFFRLAQPPNAPERTFVRLERAELLTGDLLSPSLAAEVRLPYIHSLCLHGAKVGRPHRVRGTTTIDSFTDLLRAATFSPTPPAL